MNKYLDIKAIVIDVDGTMTDGGIYYDSFGNELKKFNTRDAAGIFAARCAGIKTVVLTGRESAAVQKRMQELKVDYVIQGVRDKKEYLENFMREYSLSKEEVGYVGDDLNDYLPMKLTGFVCCPQDACEEIKSISDYVSVCKGGEGVVRDCIMHLLKKRGQWEQAISTAYNYGV